MKKVFLFFLLISCSVKEVYGINEKLRLSHYTLEDRVSLKEKELVYKLFKEDQDVEKLTKDMISKLLVKINKYRLKKEEFNLKVEEIGDKIEKLSEEYKLNYTEEGAQKGFKYLLQKTIRNIALSLENSIINFDFHSIEELNEKGSSKIVNYTNSLFKKYLESIEEAERRNKVLEFRESFIRELTNIFNIQGNPLDEYFNIKSYIYCKVSKEFDMKLFEYIVNDDKNGIENLALNLKKEYFYFISSVIESLDLIKNLKIIFDNEKSGRYENVFGKCEYIKPSFTTSTLGGKKEDIYLMLSEKGVIYINNKKAYKGIPLKVRKYTIN